MTQSRNRLFVPLLAATVVLVVVDAAAQGMGSGQRPGMGMGRGMGMGMDRGDMVRHRTFMMQGLPEDYRNLQNPLPATPETVAAGRELYDENCALCHGPEGRGDGEGTQDLDPPPGDLMALRRMPMATDGYYFWTISEGGEPLGTDMLAFKDILSAEERWKIITALRAGLPKSQ